MVEQAVRRREEIEENKRRGEKRHASTLKRSGEINMR